MPEQDNSEVEDSNNLTLFKFSYIDEDGHRSVDWVWLSSSKGAQEHLDSLEDGVLGTFREATEDELDLANESFADGYGVGMSQAQIEASNGVFFRVDSFDMFAEQDEMMKTTKVFTCGNCRSSNLEFEEKVARISDYYIAKEKDGVLWHVCLDCELGGDYTSTSYIDKEKN